MRLRAALTAAVLLGASLAGVAGAHEGENHSDQFTVTQQFVQVPEGPGSTTTIDLWTSIFVPKSATARRPAPVVLYTHGWSGRHDTAHELAKAEFLAKNGYVVIGWDSRGFGESGGWVELNSPDYEVQDARRMIDLAATLPYVLKDRPGDPRAGMVGNSYGGGIQLMTAAFDRRLDAIVPQITYNNINNSLAPNNVAKLAWVLEVFGAGVSSGLFGDTPPGEHSHAPDYPVDPILAQFVLEGLVTGTLTTTARAALDYRSPSRWMDRIRTPALFIHGMGDTLFSWNEGVANYEGLRSRGVPTRLIQSQGGHSEAAAPGEDGFTGGRDDVIGHATLNWFAKYLRRQNVSTGPPVLVRRPWVSISGRDGYSPFAPMAAMPRATRSLALDAVGKALLSKSAPAGTATVVQTGAVPTSFTELSGFSRPGDPGDLEPFDAPGTLLTFDTAALSAPMTVIGIPRVSLSVGSTGTDTVLFFKLMDVAEDGTAQLIRRTVMPFRVATSPTGLPARVELDLFGLSHKFEAGHRLRLAVSTNDFSYLNTRQPAVYTLFTGAATGSLLTLPVVG